MIRKAIKSAKLFGTAVGITAISAGGWAGYLRASGNFHVVDEGAVYRSGQLSGPQFSARIRENGIRTIINLRGNNAGSRWYDDEVKASAAADVAHIDFPISASRELTDQQITQLAGLLTTSPRPILIHCEGGADRTGLPRRCTSWRSTDVLRPRQQANFHSVTAIFPGCGAAPTQWTSRSRGLYRTFLSRIRQRHHGPDWKRPNDCRYRVCHRASRRWQRRGSLDITWREVFDRPSSV